LALRDVYNLEPNPDPSNCAILNRKQKHCEHQPSIEASQSLPLSIVPSLSSLDGQLPMPNAENVSPYFQAATDLRSTLAIISNEATVHRQHFKALSDCRIHHFSVHTPSTTDRQNVPLRINACETYSSYWKT
jgi:hypothetical protein